MRWIIFILLIALSLLSACESGPRFTHVDVDGPAPYVFFDQKTQQLCWGSADPDLYEAGKPVTITVRLHDSATQTKMPVCKDLK